MKKIRFKESIYELFDFFRYKGYPDDKMIDQWYEKLSYIDNAALPFIIDQIELLDNLPRNIPKLFKSHYSQYTRQNKKLAMIDYDPYDDPRYPIEYLYRATEILKNKGSHPFLEYCQDNKMPSQDIERVRNKVNCIFDREKVKGLINTL